MVSGFWVGKTTRQHQTEDVYVSSSSVSLFVNSNESLKKICVDFGFYFLILFAMLVLYVLVCVYGQFNFVFVNQSRKPKIHFDSKHSYHDNLIENVY